MCKQDLYYQESDGSCIACPSGAKCDRDGIALEDVYPKEGYWRANNATDIFSDCSSAFPSDPNARQTARGRCCPLVWNISICANLSFLNTNDQCLTGYTGPLCAGCAPDHVQMGRSCISCPGGASISSVFNVLLGVMGVFYLGVLIYLLCVKSNRKKAERQVGGGVETTEKTGHLIGHIKILVLFGQLLASMPVAFDAVPWPPDFLNFVNVLGVVVNLDVFFAFAWGGCQLALPAFEQFIVHMCLPALMLVTVGLAYQSSLVCLCCSKEESYKSRQRRLRLQTSTKLSMFIIQLIYPGLATRIFSIFRCRSISISADESMSRFNADYNYACHVGKHGLFEILAAIFLVVYVFGVPFLVLYILLRNRPFLHARDTMIHPSIEPGKSRLVKLNSLVLWSKTTPRSRARPPPLTATVPSVEGLPNLKITRNRSAPPKISVPKERERNMTDTEEGDEELRHHVVKYQFGALYQRKD